MVLVLNWPISMFFSLVNLCEENVFYEILNSKKKNTFPRHKTRSWKDRRTDIFSKGLVHGLGPRLVNIPSFFLSQSRRGKCVLWHSKWKKKKPYYAIIKRKSKKWRNWVFSKALVSSWFWSKIGRLSIFFY